MSAAVTATPPPVESTDPPSLPFTAFIFKNSFRGGTLIKRLDDVVLVASLYTLALNCFILTQLLYGAKVFVMYGEFSQSCGGGVVTCRVGGWCFLPTSWF